MNSRLSYKKSGVDIDIADTAKQEMSDYIRIDDSRVLNRLGAFASLFEAKFDTIKEPVLVLKIEEPGSKQLLAVRYKKIRGIGFDLVNHLVNDIIVMGARPFAVLDAIICGKLEKDVVVEIVKSISDACKEQECSLVGGETSEQPRVIPEGVYILCASGVGIVDKQRIIDGSRIELGDSILGLASNGLHTNGYSLIRKIIEEDQGILEENVGNETFLDSLLRPHKCYYHDLKDLFSMMGLHGLAHITGGGIEWNLDRILPEGLSASINLSKIRVLPIFKKIRDKGKISDSEMIHTFNLGVGMIIVAEHLSINKIKKHLLSKGCESYEIGKIVKGNKTVEFKEKLRW